MRPPRLLVAIAKGNRHCYLIETFLFIWSLKSEGKPYRGFTGDIHRVGGWAEARVGYGGNLK